MSISAFCGRRGSDTNVSTLHLGSCLSVRPSMTRAYRQKFHQWLASTERRLQSDGNALKRTCQTSIRRGKGLSGRMRCRHCCASDHIQSRSRADRSGRYKGQDIVGISTGALEFKVSGYPKGGITRPGFCEAEPDADAGLPDAVSRWTLSIGPPEAIWLNCVIEGGPHDRSNCRDRGTAFPEDSGG